MPKSEPRFTVIIATHDYGRFLGRALDSVLSQEGAAFEVVVIDDGSTDDTADIVAGYGDRVVYHYQDRAGPYRACQRGVERTARDRYIVFLDADDRLRPGFLRAMGEALRRAPETEILFGRVINVSAGGREKPTLSAALSGDHLTDFKLFIRGQLELSAGGAVFARAALDPLAGVLERFGSFHGLDRVLVAQGLARGACRVAPRAEVEVHDHSHRLRDDADSFCATGLRAVEALFQPNLLPEAALRFRRQFLVRLLLEQGRLQYRRGRHREAAERYRRAMWCDPRAALCGRHVRRLLVSTLRSGRIGLPDRSAAPASNDSQALAKEPLHDDG